MSWSHLIRFLDDVGRIHYGEPDISDASQLLDLFNKGELFAQVFAGENFLSLVRSSQRLHVKELLGVLRSADVPIIRCVGLNYMKHIQEGGRKPPPYPSIFFKPSTCVAAFDDDVPIPKIAQDTVDYEGELAIVIGKPGRDISEDDALDHVVGYVTSNDISCRKWQRDPAFAGSLPQWCFSKGFDKYAPLGPMLVSAKVVGPANKLRLRTLVNGEVRQDSNTEDLLFNVPKIINFVSQGTTLEKGTVIMTGTPGGVGMGMKPTPVYLKDGDVVEVQIDALGSTRNMIKFE